MKILMIVLSALFLTACGESKKETVEREVAAVPNNSTIVLDDNQSIGYVPNTDVTIINMGDNSYYIVCGSGECPIHIDNSVDESTSDSSTTTSDSSTTTYTDSNTTAE